MNTTYLVLSLVVGPLIGGGLVYYIQSRIRINETKETTAIQGAAAAAATPYQVLQQQLQSKDAQIAQAQQQHHEFVASQMARNDATTQAVLALAEQVRVQTGNLKDVSTALHEHRVESSARAGKIYEQVGKVNERLAGIESNIKSTLESAQDAAASAKEAAEVAEKAVREAKSA